jgi:hypothetical protein
MFFRWPRLVLLSFFLTVSIQLNAANLTAALGTAAPKETLEMTNEWLIYLPASPHQALTRAARDLQSFLREQRHLDLRIQEGSRKGPGVSLQVENRGQEDSFSLRASPRERQLIVEGSSPRAVYQGVLVLEDQLAGSLGVSATLNRRVVFPFKDRYLIWNALLTGQNKGALGFDLERHVREAVRLGYTGMECNRFMGMKLLQQGNPRDPYPWYTYWGPSMDQFVTSPLFEGVFPKEYLERNLADLKQVVGLVESFGLKPLFVGYEPRYVPESFLALHPDLRGPRVDHPLRSMTPRYSLCTDRSEVLEHYRVLAERLIRQVPGIREMHVIFHDSGAGLCWWNGLYSGRNGPAFCQNVQAGERMRKFFGAIQQGLRDGGGAATLVAQTHGITRKEVDEFFEKVPPTIEMTSGNWASWNLGPLDPLGIDRHVLSRQRETGRRTIYYQQHFFGFDIAPTSEFPLPYGLAERLQKARGLQLDVLNTLGGMLSPPIKERSVMQEVYRNFLLDPEVNPEELVSRVATDLGGAEGSPLLISSWKEIHSAFAKIHFQLGFGTGIEYASRRLLVRPLVPDPSGLLPEERDWWQAFTFGGDLRFGHAHLFRNEGGLPTADFYCVSRDRSILLAGLFQRHAAQLQGWMGQHPEAVKLHPYLASHQRQLVFLGHVYATGAALYEGQRILDKYSKKNIEDDLKGEIKTDLAAFQNTVANEITNSTAFLKLVEEGGDIGMTLLPEETTWGYGPNLPGLLRKKMEIMQRHLPEAREVLARWFDSEY